MPHYAPAMSAPDDSSLLAPPAEPVARIWVAGLTLATVGMFAAFFGPMQVLLAEHAEQVAPSNKELVFGVVTGVGAAVAALANPLFGALSDRTASRFGRRVPWVAGGAAGVVAGLVVLVGAGAVIPLVVGWCLVQAAGNAVLAAISAAVPDRAPDWQRGAVGGWMALGQTIGALTGVGLAYLTGGYRAGYLACAVVAALLVVPYLLRSDDRALAPGTRPSFELRSFLRGFWIDPRRHPDFGWAWATRFLVQLSNSIGTLYLFFYLSDEVRYDDPERGVLVLLVVYSVFVVLTSVTSGWWSDKVRRRKAFVTWAGVVMSSAGVLLAVWPSWTGAIVAAAVLGVGFGAFLAVDFAILTEVLPNPADYGKDLGVINIANTLSQVLAPAIAAPMLWLGGYRTLYAVAAAIGLAGAFAVRWIGSVP